MRLNSSFCIVQRQKKNKMKKRYTKRQILESIKYWQKQLRAGNYKKLNESVASLTPHELELAEGYFAELFSEYGYLPKKIQVEAVKYKDDPSIGDGDEYERMLEKYGPVNWFWLADEFSEFADSGRYIPEYASAFSKLAKAGYMSIDKNGFVTFDTNRIIGDEDATITFK